ncbi:immunoglobulin kappa light chain-like [Pholidichthys leucotaenia]
MAQKTPQKLSFSVHQEKSFILANVGKNVTLRCFWKSDDSLVLYWYKQTAGHEPRLISTYHVYDTKNSFHNEFKNSSRFKLEAKNCAHHLSISDLQVSDSATYYCASCYTYVLNFTEGTIVTVKGPGLKSQPLVYQSVCETIQLEGSVTLNCTVQTGSCDGQHSVYWFKIHENSHRVLIDTQGRRDDQCEAHTCVYKLQMTKLNLSHTGTYYCAVASCGHIIFGNGTKLDFSNEVDSPQMVYYLTGALTLVSILLVVLAFSVYRIIKDNKSRHLESAAHCTTNAEVSPAVESCHYAALDVNQLNRSRRQRSTTGSECLYSGVKL